MTSQLDFETKPRAPCPREECRGVVLFISILLSILLRGACGRPSRVADSRGKQFFQGGGVGGLQFGCKCQAKWIITIRPRARCRLTLFWPSRKNFSLSFWLKLFLQFRDLLSHPQASHLLHFQLSGFSSSPLSWASLRAITSSDRASPLSRHSLAKHRPLQILHPDHYWLYRE